MSNRPIAARLVVILGLTVAMGACDDTTGPGEQGLQGAWSGTAALPNGFTASMDLQQTGTAISGEMSIAGSFRDRPITGTHSSSNRTFIWTVADGCDRWSGTLNISADGSEMDGPIVLDRSGCSAGSDASGTLRLDRAAP